MKNLAWLYVAALAACGGGTGSSANPGGVGNPDAGAGGPDAGSGAGPCTMTFTGDSAANLPSVTSTCGSLVGIQSDFTHFNLGPPVEVQLQASGALHEMGLVLADATTSRSVVFAVVSSKGDLPTTFTNAAVPPGVSFGLVFTDVAGAGASARSWQASAFSDPTTGQVTDVFGTFTFDITSVTPTDAADCKQLNNASTTISSCSRVHGNFHATAVPAHTVNNHAAGTVTVDGTF